MVSGVVYVVFKKQGFLAQSNCPRALCWVQTSFTTQPYVVFPMLTQASAPVKASPLHIAI